MSKFSGFKSKKRVLRFGYVQTAVTLLFFQIFVVFGIGKCSALAPDEKSYLQVFEDLYINDSSNFLGYAGTSTWIYELFFSPAFLLANLGIEPIYSIRGSAVIHSHVVLALSWKYLNRIPKTFKPPIFLIPLGLSLSFVFFSSFGLRESIIFLNLIFYFSSLELLKKNKQFTGGLLLLASLVIFANLKSYIYFLIIASTILSLIVLRNRAKLKTITFVIILSFFSTFVTSSSELGIVNNVIKVGGLRFEVGDLKLFKPNSVSFFKNNTVNESVSRLGILECQRNDSLGFLKPLIIGAFSLDKVAADQSDKVAADQSDKVAATNFYALDKPRELIILGHLPFNLINFMIGPIPGTSGGVSYLGLLDSLIWLSFFFFIFLALFGRTRFRLILDQVVIFAMSFFLAFTLFSAAIEVNTGTSFRHRTVLYIPLLIILSRLHPRNSSSNQPKLPIAPNAPGNFNQ